MLSGQAVGGRTVWPLWSALPPMAALGTVPAAARAHLRATLAGWQLPGLTEPGELVVSELATNAVRASTAGDGTLKRIGGRIPVMRLRLFSDGVRLLIECHDEAPGFPVIREPSADAEYGRGLILVASLAGGAWGWRAPPGGHGKCVWAVLSSDAR